MGNLYTFVSKLPQRTLTLTDAITVFGQIGKGVGMIHSKNIIHRDIKLENILLKRNSKGGYTCKIGDFGLARFLEVQANSNCGTQNYMAP
jgi:serine/threonine protein kinase